MLRQNTIQAGIILGFLLPFVVFVVLRLLFDGLEQGGVIGAGDFSENFRMRTIALVAIGLNVILLNQFQQNYRTQSMRGVVIATAVYVIVWLVYFGNSIF